MPARVLNGRCGVRRLKQDRLMKQFREGVSAGVRSPLWGAPTEIGQAGEVLWGCSQRWCDVDIVGRAG